MARLTSVVTVTLNPAIDQTLSIPGFAMGQVNRVAESRSDAGGKGVNVASVLSGLGIQTIATGFLGSDNAAPFENLFLRKQIEDRFVRIAGSTRAGIKIVDIHQTTDINFPGLSPTADDLAELNGRIAALAEPGRWFVLSGSVPPGVPSGIYAEMIDLIHGKGGCVALDTSGPALRAALASRPEVMKPNVEELSELVGHEPGNLRAAAQALGARRVAVSMGKAGAVFLDGESALLARPPQVPVRSTVGAGDAMVAGLVYGMIHELPLEEAARFATASGAYAVTRVGSGIEDPDEHRRLMSRVEIERL
ncbi:MAG: 1-phosphofructokinase [Acidobacteriota bacterium]|jgi:1-phosphofructokinase family hexose kinase|nr:1-phosphofructokinase [Acidobacteriota bacterium]